MNRHLFAAISLSITLPLAACGGSDTETYETEDGTVEVDRDNNDGEAEIRFTDNDGQETVISTGSDGDVEWPDGFSLYPGASVEGHVTMDGAEGSGAMVTITTSDSAEEVLAHYRQEAEAAGIEIQMEMTSGDTRVIGGEGPDGLGFSVNATTDDGETTAMVMAGRQ